MHRGNLSVTISPSPALLGMGIDNASSFSLFSPDFIRDHLLWLSSVSNFHYIFSSDLLIDDIALGSNAGKSLASDL